MFNYAKNYNESAAAQARKDKDGQESLPVSPAPTVPEEPDVIGVLGAIPPPTLSDALQSIADHIAMDTTEEAAQEAAVLRQAACMITNLECRLRDALAALKDAPTHEDLDAVVFQANMDRQRAEALEKELNDANKQT